MSFDFDQEGCYQTKRVSNGEIIKETYSRNWKLVNNVANVTTAKAFTNKTGINLSSYNGKVPVFEEQGYVLILQEDGNHRFITYSSSGTIYHP